MTEQREDYIPAVRDPVLVPTWERMREQAAVLHKSQFFAKSIPTPEAALAVMLAGREYGLGPMESLRSIYIVNGQTTMSSGLMAAMILQKGHQYEILQSDNKTCRIKFTRSNGLSHTHEFTHEDAVKAGLARKDIWQKYEKAMLFNRCMSAGARVFMPDAIHNLYTPEEMGAPVTVSESGDIVIDVEAREIKEPEPTTNGKPTLGLRPWKPEELRAALRHNVGQKKLTGEPNKRQVGLLAGKLEEALGANQYSQVNRYTFTEWITGERSLTKVGIAWVATMLDWLLDDKDEATGDYPFKAHAREEANLVLRQAMLDQGQQELPGAQFNAAPQEQLDGLGFGQQKGEHDA